MKSYLTLLLPLLFFISCQQEKITPANDSDTDLIALEDIRSTIQNHWSTQGVFDWNEQSAEFIYSAGMYSDSIFSIGFQPSEMTNLTSQIHSIDLNDPEWSSAWEQLLQIIENGEDVNRQLIFQDNMMPFGKPEVLPTVSLRLSNIATIRQLKRSPFVRYVEPIGFSASFAYSAATSRNIFGCNGASPNNNIDLNDYQTIAPGIKQSWHHEYAKITEAWEESTGEGVTIAVIDTGLSDDQDNLNENFNSGFSQNRTVEKLSTRYSGILWWNSLEPPHDECGHGTEMSGLAAAPRSDDGNSVGVAYNANLIGIRAVNDVVIDGSSDTEGVKDALVFVGQREEHHIISMSIGSPFSNGAVEDGIQFAHNEGKMIFAAAGTSLELTTNIIGVIFPANLPEAIAVTGVKTTSPLKKCDTCHEGGEVEFVMPVQRAENGNGPITLSRYSDTPNYSGASSASVATVAGIAALVWSKHDNLERDDILEIMRENASRYPVKDNNLGWGIIDAEKAVKKPIEWSGFPLME